MMKAHFKTENPGDIVMTLTVTMTLEHWKLLRDQLKSAWPSSDLGMQITDMVYQASARFEAARTPSE